MRAIQWSIRGAVIAALIMQAQAVLAQASSSPGTTHGATGTAPARTATRRGSSASPSPSSASPAPVTCQSGETLDHGHCCATGAEWVQAQRQCAPHNRRQALVVVVANNPHGAVPGDLAVTFDTAAMTGTPPSIASTPGHHVVDIAAAGFRPVHQDLTLTAGQIDRIAVDLEATVGRVQVTVATAGAQVLMDGHPMTGTPASQDNIAPGSHEIVVSAPDHDTVTRNITVAAGETTTLDLGDLPVPPPPPTPPPAATPVTPVAEPQLLVIRTESPQSFEVEVEAPGRPLQHCPQPVTREQPCTMRDIPAGTARITARSPTLFSDEVQLATGRSTATLDFHPSAALRGAYVALGIACFVPTVVAFVAAAGAAPTDQGTLFSLAIALIVVPGLLPGAWFLASGARTQGSGEVQLVGPSAAVGPRRRVQVLGIARAPAVLPPPLPSALIVF